MTHRASIALPDELVQFADNQHRVEVHDIAFANQLLQKLVQQHPALRDKVLDDDGWLQPHLLLIRNDVFVDSQSPVAANDQFELFLIASGG